jgi:hypothetical protein
LRGARRAQPDNHPGRNYLAPMAQENSQAPSPPSARLRWLDRAWRIVGALIIFLLIFDAAAWLGLRLVGHRETPLANPNLIYPGASWAPQMLAETDALTLAWHPYSYWRAVPSRGRYVTVGTDGLRRTWSGGAPRVTRVNARVRRVFMFGGSTMFGIDARDDYTIPSLFAKDLDRADIGNVQVTNYGQVGYVSTQEVISFLLALRADQVPDVVAFYDGFQDAVTGYRSGTTGIPMGEGQRAHEFNLLNHLLPSRRRALYRSAAETLLTESSLGVALRTLLRRDADSVDRRAEASSQVANPPARRTDMRLARAVVDDYLKNIRLAAATGASLRIPILVYWQPSLAMKDPRSAFETTLVRESAKERPGEEQFVSEVDRMLHALVILPGYRGPRITDLSTILNGQPSCFADDVHIVEACNAVIASRIAADAIPILHNLAALDRLGPHPLQSPRP